MRNHTRLLFIVAVAALLAVACGDDGDATPSDDEAPGTTAPGESSTTAPTTTAPVPENGDALVELQITAVTFGPDGSVTIMNRGADDADVGGAWICNRPNYSSLADHVDGPIAPGASVEIPADALGGLPETGGEAALYNSNDFGSSDDILAYVQWGDGADAGGRGSVATEAGLWAGTDVSVTPDPAFGGIELFGDPAQVDSWG